MANETPIPPTPTPIADPTALFMALGNPVRWAVLQKLAKDGPQSVNDLADLCGRAQHSMSRHLTLLWKLGALVAADPPDGDGRKQFSALPPGCLRETPGGKEIDYGHCVVRVA